MMQTPKKTRDMALETVTTPQLATSFFNASNLDASSSFKNLDSFPSSTISSTPVMECANTPYYIQKAAMRRRDVELKILQEQLNTEVWMREDAQNALQLSQATCLSQELEIQRLQQKLLVLNSLQDSPPEVAEMRAELEATRTKWLSASGQLQQLQKHREILEQENSSQAEELSKLHHQVNSLISNCGRCKEKTRMIEQLKSEMASQNAELQKLQEVLSQFARERSDFELSLRLSRDRNRQLQCELEELQARYRRHNDSSILAGESMNILVEMQIAEMKNQLTEVCQEKSFLETQVELSQKELNFQRQQTDRNDRALLAMRDKNRNLARVLRLRRENLARLKARHKDLKLKYFSMLTELRVCLAEKEQYAEELKVLKSAVQETAAEMYRQQLETCQQLSPLEKSAEMSLLYQSAMSSDFKLSPASALQFYSPGEDKGYDSSCDHSSSSSNGPLTRDALDEVHTGNTTRLIKSSNLYDTRTSPTRCLSLQSLKKEIATMCTNTSSCAEDKDRSSQLTNLKSGNAECDQVEKGTPQGYLATRASKGPLKQVTSPQKRDVKDKAKSQTKSKQKYSGTVIYFPKDPRGPIYPPPRPLMYPRKGFSYSWGQYLGVSKTGTVTIQERSSSAIC